MRAFFVFGGVETRDRKATRGDASPSGGREKRDPVRRQEETQARKAEGRNATPLGVPADLQSADKKRFDRFFADLKSAAVGFSYLL